MWQGKINSLRLLSFMVLSALLLLAGCDSASPAAPAAVHPTPSAAQLQRAIQYFEANLKRQVGADALSSLEILDQRVLDPQTVLVVYVYVHDKTPTIGTTALYVDDNQVWHTGSSTVQPFGPNEDETVKEHALPFYATIATGNVLLPPFTVVYGRLYNSHIARITVDFSKRAPQDATIRGTWFWLVDPGVSMTQGVTLNAYDAHSEHLGQMSF